MADERAYFHSLMRGMVVKHYPKQNCAAREIAEFWAGRSLEYEEVDYGGFSRKMRGSREWSINDFLALTSITGSQRVVQAINSRDSENIGAADSVHILTARAAKESGEGIEAALSDQDLAKAYAEADEAVNAWEALRDRLRADIKASEQRSETNTVPMPRQA